MLLLFLFPALPADVGTSLHSPCPGDTPYFLPANSRNQGLGPTKASMVLVPSAQSWWRVCSCTFSSCLCSWPSSCCSFCPVLLPLTHGLSAVYTVAWSALTSLQGPSLLGPSVLGHCVINLYLADTPIIRWFGAPVPFPPKTGRVLTVSGCLWALQTDRTVLSIHPASWWLFDLRSIWHLCMVTPEGQLADDSRLVPSTPPSFW